MGILGLLWRLLEFANLVSPSFLTVLVPWLSFPPAMTPPSLEVILANIWPPQAWADVSVLVAVSGGADSVALLRALAALKRGGDGRLMVAHFNHHLRGSESDADEQFVCRLGEELGLRCECGCPEAGQIAACAEGLEEAARNMRYQFLTRAAEAVGARYVACAHTADDQIETILQRIVRGTGIAGLAGIPCTRRLSPAVTLIRPFLQVRRCELVDYLASIGQPYREDLSNADRRFTRNRIRHELLPHLAEHYNPAVDEALLRLGRLAGEAQSLVDERVCQLLQGGAVIMEEDSALVLRGRMSTQPEYLVRETFLAVWQSQGWPLQSMGFEEWDLLVRMLRSVCEAPATVPNKRTFPGPIQAERRAEGLYLRRL